MVNQKAAERLAVELVREYWESHRAPMPGAALKAGLIRKAQESEDVFDERQLNFRSFKDFVGACVDLVSIQREGSDFVVSAASERGPVAVTAPFKAHRIRSDFWKAFVGFPSPGRHLAYDKSADRIVPFAGESPAPGQYAINSIEKEMQIYWRRQFVESLVDDTTALAASLEDHEPLRAFSAAVMQRRSWIQGWHRFLTSRVDDHISKWAQVNGILSPVWREAPKSGVELKRQQLYAFFDRIPVEDLLTISIPVEWVIGRRSDEG